jgi:hypothetical protein
LTFPQENKKTLATGEYVWVPKEGLRPKNGPVPTNSPSASVRDWVQRAYYRRYLIVEAMLAQMFGFCQGVY